MTLQRGNKDQGEVFMKMRFKADKARGTDVLEELKKASVAPPTAKRERESYAQERESERDASLPILSPPRPRRALLTLSDTLASYAATPGPRRAAGVVPRGARLKELGDNAGPQDRPLHAVNSLRRC